MSGGDNFLFGIENFQLETEQPVSPEKTDFGMQITQSGQKKTLFVIWCKWMDFAKSIYINMYI